MERGADGVRRARRIRYLARYDALTKIPNRMQVARRTAGIREGRKVSGASRRAMVPVGAVNGVGRGRSAERRSRCGLRA